MIVPRDIEEDLRQYLQRVLNESGASETDIKCYAGTTPTEFPDRSVSILALAGAGMRDIVIEASTLSFDCRSEYSETDAERLAAKTVSALLQLNIDGDLGNGAFVYKAEQFSRHYLNPDPRNPTIHRYTTTFNVTSRAEVVDNNN
jgi:hypothetical protein